MSNKKRCSGYKGHWECVDEYPDHQVPVENFGPAGDRLQARCRKCMKYRSDIHNAIRDPIRSAVLKFAKSEGIVVNRAEWRALPKSYRDEVTQRWHEQNHHSNVIPFKVKQVTNPTATLKSMVRNDGLPEGIVTKSEKKVRREAKKIKYSKPGWVYALKDHMKQPGFLKIGSTNDLRRRLADFNTAGDFEMMYFRKVPDCKKAETDVQIRFEEQNHIREWFKVSLKDAVEAIDIVADLSVDPDWEGIVDVGDPYES